MRAASMRRIVTAAVIAALASVLPMSHASSGPQGAAPADNVSSLLRKASDYVAGYVKALSSVVSEERYEQFLAGGPETLDGRAAYSNFRRFKIDTSIEIK